MKALHYNLRRGTCDSSDGELRTFYCPVRRGFYFRTVAGQESRRFKTQAGLNRSYRRGKVTFQLRLPSQYRT